jgi:hypothetical protein
MTSYLQSYYGFSQKCQPNRLIVGPTGSSGIGRTGPTGAQGIQGNIGPTGSNGLSITGPTGIFSIPVEFISSSIATLNTEGLSIINTYNGPVTATLPDASSTGTLKFVQLDHATGNEAIINTSQGSFFVHPGLPTRTLMYTGNPYWSIQSDINVGMFPTQQQAILSQTGTAGLVGTFFNFGACMDCSADGNTLLVGYPGASDASVGAGIVYVRTGTSWSFQAGLQGVVNQTSGDNQGSSVALSSDGNVAAIGGPNNDSTTTGTSDGRVWIFNRTGTAWTETASLAATDQTGTNQGFSVALSSAGTILAVGAPSFTGGQGAGCTYIWKQSGGIWPSTPTQQVIGTYISSFTGLSSQGQGINVCLSSDGTILSVLSGYQYLSNPVAGIIFVFQLINNSYTQIASLSSSDGVGTIAFGHTMRMSGDGAMIIVSNYTNNAQTSATNYGTDIFYNQNGFWSQGIIQSLINTGLAVVDINKNKSTIFIAFNPGTASAGSVITMTSANNLWIQSSEFNYTNTLYVTNSYVKSSALGDTLFVAQQSAVQFGRRQFGQIIVYI